MSLFTSPNPTLCTEKQVEVHLETTAFRFYSFLILSGVAWSGPQLRGSSPLLCLPGCQVTQRKIPFLLISGAEWV